MATAPGLPATREPAFARDGALAPILALWLALSGVRLFALAIPGSRSPGSTTTRPSWPSRRAASSSPSARASTRRAPASSTWAGPTLPPAQRRLPGLPEEPAPDPLPGALRLQHSGAPAHHLSRSACSPCSSPCSGRVSCWAHRAGPADRPAHGHGSRLPASSASYEWGPYTSMLLCRSLGFFLLTLGLGTGPESHEAPPQRQRSRKVAAARLA